MALSLICKSWTKSWFRLLIWMTCFSWRSDFKPLKLMTYSVLENKNISFEIARLLIRQLKSLKWKRINCKQSIRWQHVSRLKASAFSLQKNLVSCMKHNNLYSGLVTPSSGWWSPIVNVNTNNIAFALILIPLNWNWLPDCNPFWK
jgi:hypothetical protein